MPNRIIKETIAKSERVSGLTDFQFRLWVHLLTYVDDYGRGDARSAIIRGACFPLHSRMKNRDIENGLAALAAAGCIRLYEAEGRPYLYFPTWDKHQRVRQKVSKCPDPESCGELQQAAADGGEMLQKAARIQNPNPNPESESESESAARADAAFERFWSAYPRKEGKKKARSAFEKAGVPLDTLLQALEQQKHCAQWTRDNGQYIPHAATWLSGKRWEDQMAGAEYVPKGAAGVLGEAERAAIRRILEEEIS